MTYTVGKSRIVGDYRITVISEQDVTASASQFGAYGKCTKYPVFVMLQHGPVTIIRDMNGDKVPLAQVMSLCPAVTA